jgi:hypothetical protein
MPHPIPADPPPVANDTNATPGSSQRHRSVSGVVQGWFQHLQALEDAIAYRRARVTVPCPDCGAAPLGQKCDDHARDLELIAEYQASARHHCESASRDPAPAIHGDNQ